MNFKTGDLLLFNNYSKDYLGWFTDLIKWGTHSNYTHVAMILKDPTFIHPSLKGLYVWESTYDGLPDPQDGKIKLGVQITPLLECLNIEDRYVYVRTLNYPKNTFNDKILTEIHNTVYDKPYDIVPSDWIQALFKVDTNPQKTSRFWCSALIGYIYTKCGILNKNTDWSILRPSDFSLDGENLNFNLGFSLNNCEKKK
jgi:cell wall-associated NlpC family hydrolase